MADVRLNPQQLVRAGIAPTYTGSLSATDTYLVNNGAPVFLHFKKTGAGACTVTVQTPATASGLAIAEHTFSVPATTGDVMAGPFQPDLFSDAVGDIRFTLSDIVGLSVAVVRT